MSRQTQSRPKVSISIDQEIIIEYEDDMDRYGSVAEIRNLKEQAEYGLHHPINDEVIEACNKVLDARFY